MGTGHSHRKFGRVVMMILSNILIADEAGVGPPLKAETAENSSVAPTPQPEKKDPESVWMDQSQEWINEALYKRVVWLDSMFYNYGDDLSVRKDPRSRFRLKVFSVMDPENLEGSSVDAKASASVRLPGLKNRFRLILDSDGLNTFPGSQPDEAEGANRLSLRRVGSWLDTDVGAKVRTPPVAFARLSARHNLFTGPVEWHFNQRFYYETGEGFGMLPSLAQHCWLHKRWMLGHVSSLRWSESTTGVEWQDSFTLLRVLQVLEDKDHGTFIGNSDISHGAGIRLGANGQDEGSHEMSRYQLALVYRRPLFKRDYLYLEISPEVQWKQDNDWNPDYNLRVGLDMLFWRDR
ncbi:MAG: hypothetical protein WD708_00980 [Kiritimatiellia bacterium]